MRVRASHCCGFSGAQALGTRASVVAIWYRRVPQQWTDMIPIGNGHMGAMIAGRPEREYLILNEDTIWAGGPYDHLNPDATPEKLAQMRQLIFDGKADQAGNIANSSFISRPSAEMAYSVAGALGLEQKTGDGDVTTIPSCSICWSRAAHSGVPGGKPGPDQASPASE